MQLNILGIRHHGVGSAINVKRRLEDIAPDCILIEGAPELMDSLEGVDLADFTPPLAIMGYNRDSLEQSIYYPFASFSPEWQGMLYAQKHNIDYRFADLPLKSLFGMSEDMDISQESPLEDIARLDGFESGDVWWEQYFEQGFYIDAKAHFEAVLVVMRALRDSMKKSDIHNQRREAFMREEIRKAIRDGRENIVFICGAWHSPALEDYASTRKQDGLLMKKLPRKKVETTWIPWTNSRLSWQSGYGAGLSSPGWYGHLWDYPDDDGKQWLLSVAEQFRKKDLDISTAHIIETFNLADSLRQMRGLGRIGLSEMEEAIVSVMCMGETILLDFIGKELTIGHKMGIIPSGLPKLPIQKDFDSLIKSYRLQIREDEKIYKLDLRTPAGLKKSIFLHRLRVLDIGWGNMESSRSKGSFKEVWSLQWKPEMTLQIIDKGIWGNSIEIASENYILNIAKNSQETVEISNLIKQSLLAELFGCMDALIDRIEVLVSLSFDVGMLIQSLLPLMDISRYDDIRNTDKDTLSSLIDGLLHKVIINLESACYGLDESLARDMFGYISSLNGAIVLMEDDELETLWIDTLYDISQESSVAYLIQGAISRILFDRQKIDDIEIETTMSRVLSIGEERIDSAYWIEGFLDGSAMILILDDTLWNILYIWLDGLDSDTFDEVLPIMRRTFSVYAPDIRKKLGEKAKGGISKTKKPISQSNDNIDDKSFDTTRAMDALEATIRILG